MDLKAYHSQIIALIPLRNEPDFNELLDKILFGEKNSDKFIIKMELTRLSTPCQRVLDMRDKVTDPCILFQLGNIEHYLTKDSVAVLQKNIQLYGQYTVGVFEAVHEYVVNKKNKFNANKNTLPAKTNKLEQCDFLSFSQKNKRGAPRMFFVSDITLTTDGTNSFIAQTSNISLTGLKVKFAGDALLTNESILTVTFDGLAHEYHEKVLQQPITYQLIKQERDEENDYCYYYLNYRDKNRPFILFLAQFIRLNQYKYKIDVHYYYQLAKISALKHSYLEKMSSLPIYLNANASTPFLFALKSETNKQLLSEWQCEEVQQLPVLFHELRFIKHISHIKKQYNTTVYTFTHSVNNKQYFLSATEEELHEADLKETFITYGRSKDNWHAYHLTLQAYQYQSYNEYDITEHSPAIFEKVTHLATLQRLNHDYPFNSHTILNKEAVNQLNRFVHREHGSHAPLQIFTLLSDEQRKEERYLYSSKVSVADKNSHYNGHMIDFSCSGLKIKLDQISAFSNGEKVVVSLSELQKLSPNFPLSELHYKIVRAAPHNTLHLQVCDKKTLQICQQFFPVLVRNNVKHFTCIPLKESQQPTGKYLVEVAEESFNNAVFFVSRVAARPKILFSAIDDPDHPLITLFSLHSDNKEQLNYYPLANNQLFERLVAMPLKEGEDTTTLIKEALIYIRVAKDNEHQWEINSFLDEDFKSEQERVTFIKESQFNATFYALHFRLTAIPHIDLRSIESEIHAISRFAIHLTKKLEEELFAVEAMIEIIDRSADIINSVASSLDTSDINH